jgi:parvulin-like peptidyl-prolyl isomerase
MKAAYADHMRNTALKISVVGLLAAGIAVAYLSLTRDVSQPPKPGMTLVAEVNGKPITAEVFNEKYSRFTLRFHVPVAESPTSVSELKLGFLNKLIETELLLQEAEVRSLTVTDEELDREISHLKEDYPKDTLNEALERIGLKLDEWKEDRKEKLLIDKLIKREVDSVIHVSDDEIREYYDANKDEFQQPLMVRARQIVVGTEEEADALRTRLVRGEDFAEIARLHSLSPDAQSGGDLGVFAKGQMPEVFDEIVFRYRVGSISKVVKSPYGYHIFKVEDRIRPRLQKIEEVRDQIAAAIFQGRQEAFFKDWLDSLKKQARIIIYPENLEDIS